ncbi:putative membrane dipeptidase [Mycobacterium xenopi 3993]|nr:putative membrane dipeptidase [Mycobacterium xenopi 3993]
MCTRVTQDGSALGPAHLPAAAAGRRYLRTDPLPPPGWGAGFGQRRLRTAAPRRRPDPAAALPPRRPGASRPGVGGPNGLAADKVAVTFDLEDCAPRHRPCGNQHRFFVRPA